MPYPSLSRTLRVMGLDGAQAGGKRASADASIAESPTRSPRAGLVSSACSPSWPTKTPDGKLPEHTRSRRERSRAVYRSRPIQTASANAAAWAAIIERARDRFTGPAARELADALDGIEAAKQLGRLAKRVSDLLQGKPDHQTVVVASGRPIADAVWPCTGRSTSTSSLSRTTWSCGSVAICTGRRC